MSLLYYIGVPTIICGSIWYIKQNNVTKEDCIHYSLQTIGNLGEMYKNLENNVTDIINNYTKPIYRNFEIIESKSYLHNITKIKYNYNENIYTIMYDDTYPLNKVYNKGDTININIDNTITNNKIAFMEYVNTNTDKTQIINDKIKNYILELSGPNRNFYNHNDQPLYIPSNLLDNDLKKDIQDYCIQITYMNLTNIHKNIKII